MADKVTNSKRTLPWHARRIMQNFLLVWLDANIDESVLDFQNSLAQLRRVVVSIETYKDAEECIEFIRQVKEEKVFMIVSGALGQNVVPEIEKWPQIDSIYVFCNNVTVHKKWANDFPIVKGVHNHIKAIRDALKIDRQRCDQNMMPISFQGIDPLFMYTQLVKEAILEVEDDDEVSIKELVEYCRDQDDVDRDEIKLIEQEYHNHKPIWWYTAPYFMYSMLNRGLRVFDVNILLKLGFFMRQLYRHIVELHKEQESSSSSKILKNASFQVFRGQALSNGDFEKLKQTKNGLMSFNNFLSTSYERTISLRDFARPAAFITNSVGILFVIQIDRDLCKKVNIPFAEITGEIGYFQEREAEILFSTHTLFRIKEVEKISDPDTDLLYEVHLSLASPDDNELNQVAESMRKEIGTRRGLPRLAYVLRQAGLTEQSGLLYKTLLDSAISEDDKAEYNYQLGWVYNKMGKHEQAATYYQRYYDMKRKVLPENHIEFAKYYNHMGMVYLYTNNINNALSYLERSLKIRETSLPENHPDLAISYNDIGVVYCEMGEFTEALSAFQQSLEIRKRAFPPNHPDLAYSYNSIGAAHEKMGEYSKALSAFQQSLEIRKRAFPPNHPDFACTYNNIRVVYEKMGEYSKALSSLQQLLEIRKQSLPSNHPDLAHNYNEIGIVYNNMGDYAKALSAFQQSLKIRKQLPVQNHLELAISYNNIGNAYHSLGQYSRAVSSHQNSLEMRKQALPVNHLDLARTYESIGIVLTASGEYAEAISSHEKSLEIRKHNLSSDDPALAHCYNNIGVVYEKMGEYTTSLSYFERSLEIRKKSLPSNHPDTILTEKNIEIVKNKL